MRFINFLLTYLLTYSWCCCSVADGKWLVYTPQQVYKQHDHQCYCVRVTSRLRNWATISTNTTTAILTFTHCENCK